MKLEAVSERFWNEVACVEVAAQSTRIKLRHLTDCLGAVPIGQIDGGAVSRMVLTRRKSLSRHGRPFSARSVNFEVALLRRMLKHARTAWGEEVQPINWPDLMLREQSARRWILSADEEARLLVALPLHLRTPVRLVMLTGMHLKAAVGLRWEDVDLFAGFFSLRGFGGGQYALPITATARTILDDQGASPAGHVFAYKRIGRDQAEPIRYWHHAWLAACERAD